MKKLLLLIILMQLSACGINQINAKKIILTPKEKNSKKEEWSSDSKIHYKKQGMASYYGGGDGLHNKKTASGEKFDKNALTAAHPSLPFNSMVRVTNLENKKHVIVKINDRGPFTKKRIIDISERAAEIIDIKRKGSAKVLVEYLGDATKAIKIKPKNKKADK